MEKVIIIRYSEMHLKGKNRGWFERVFSVNMEKSLKGMRHEIRRYSGRYLVENFDENQTEKIFAALKKVFGIHSYSVGLKTPADLDSIFAAANAVCDKSGTFKVESHRADKTFPLNSMQISAHIGGRLLDSNPQLKVDVHDPQFVINVDIRENGTALVFNKFFKGAGGMPVGTSGKGLLLISGGIDSPVAGHMIAKRGMEIDCIHFHSYPYTNMQAREKVEELAEKLSAYTCGTKLNIVSVTHIQEEIHKKCNGDYMVTLLRRFMMRIAERVALKSGAQCLITGESLAQVASQTIEGMTSSNSVVQKLPVLRPLCGFDKDEIIERSRDIGTYETSIEPYEDCCTVFLPKHPVTRPKMSDVLAEEEKLDVEKLIEEALSTLEVIKI
ncbi:MAG TPA: tRNA 4-thiouridine(8) synthase ThiI [Clostridiales bacterium]|nr:tRNA 4-thiouridine(8) synthase ThiI [Clostridiales bacterium]